MVVWKLALMALFGMSPFATTPPKAEEKKAGETPAKVLVEVKKPTEGKPESAKTTKVEEPKPELKKLESAKVVTGQNILIQKIHKVEAPKAETKSETKTITLTQVAGPQEASKNEDKTIRVLKVDSKNQEQPKVITVTVEPNGEVKVIQGEKATEAKVVRVTGTAIAIQEKAGEGKPKEEVKKATVLPLEKKNILIQAKPEAGKSEGSKTLELRITIEGDNPPKVEVLKGPEANKKAAVWTFEPKTPSTDAKATGQHKVEMRTIEIPGGGVKTVTGTAVSVGGLAVPAVPGVPVMKFVFTEDGKSLKVESDAKAKAEVIELQAAIKAAEKAQAEAHDRAMALRKKAEALREQAMKDAADAKSRAEKAIIEMKPTIIQGAGQLKELEKEIRIKVLGEVKDMQKHIEAKLVEAKKTVDAEQDKFEQLSKRLDKLEKAIDELYKKVK